MVQQDGAAGKRINRRRRFSASWFRRRPGGREEEEEVSGTARSGADWSLGLLAWKVSPSHLVVVIVILSCPFCAALELVVVVLLVFLLTCRTRGVRFFLGKRRSILFKTRVRNILATFSVIFLVLFINFLVLFIIYVGLAVLLVLLKHREEVQTLKRCGKKFNILFKVQRKCFSGGTAERWRGRVEAMEAVTFPLVAASLPFSFSSTSFFSFRS